MFLKKWEDVPENIKNIYTENAYKKLSINKNRFHRTCVL